MCVCVCVCVCVCRKGGERGRDEAVGRERREEGEKRKRERMWKK